MDFSLFDYQNFNAETKEYLNIAMSIYSAISTKQSSMKVRKFGEEIDYKMTNLDKKILSLFIAAFFIKGNIKQMLDEYELADLEKLFSFVNLKKEEIKMLEDDYAKFYENHFKLDLINIIKSGYPISKPNIINLGVIFHCFGDVNVAESDILNYFCNFAGIKQFWLNANQFFNSLESYLILNNYISKNTLENDSGKSQQVKVNKSKEQEELASRKIYPFIDINSIVGELKRKFIGQEVASENLFYNILNNLSLANLNNIPDGQRSIIFMDGPSGTGKTAITKEITQKLGVPFVASSITKYSSSGYVGSDLTELLASLYKNSGENLDKAERGVIVLDEFDKITYSSNGGLEMKKAVQQELLDFLGGGTYLINVGESRVFSDKIEFDTSKLTFICLGALTDLRTNKTTKKRPLGFNSNFTNEDVTTYTITPQDLINIGLEKELVGRFNTYLHTNDYSKEDLMRILKESSISPLLGFKMWIERNGKSLVIDDNVYEIIVDKAYELNTGARSLQTIMNTIRTPFIKEVLGKETNTIYLDSNTVKRICDQSISRGSRG